ncbi:conserved hypothetical protein [Agrobacterium fabacearum CFBP 5771]|uniref:hypothetical protein n=1 Tax=Agrobacterium tumefaciens TaxID=358 RepID=UPI00047056B9|nr:hypothetical protein [Agrobacterium tumefaciens]CVI14849.1 conserved hypothetical protein [Agrobacterium fabacearum CFBP 5771]
MSLAQFVRGAVSAERIREKMLRSGFTLFGQKLWGEDEDLVCRLVHPDIFALRQILYARSEGAIRARCRKLGLTSPRRTWGPLDKQRLRKLYPEATHDELRTAFPGVEIERIRRVAHYYGYRRKRKPYKITGVVPLDQLRVRAYDNGWYMPDIDDEAGTGRYFRSRGYKSKYPNFKAIQRGVKVLGGRLEAVWDE